MKPRREPRMRRGIALYWGVAALAVAAAMTPMYVALCRTLSQATRRGGYRLIATQHGQAALDDTRRGLPKQTEFPVPELPSGRGNWRVQQEAGTPLTRLTLTITWLEDGRTARAEWTTLRARP